MKIAFALLISASVLSATINPVGTATPNPDQVYIAGITYGGTGCPQGTVSAAFTADRKTVTMIFDQFLAQAGKGINPANSRSACQINVDLRYPSDWSYTVMKVDYRGYVGIPAGFSALQTATYYFSGNSAQLVSKSNFMGPIYQDYKVTDEIPLKRFIWSPCGNVVRGNIKASVELQGDFSKSGLITVDSVDGTVKHMYGILWRSC